VAQYETPGTQAFAETVLPFVKEHNAILLGNHGVVTWADTPTLAEWHCEILETYCATLAHARQLQAPLGYIAGDKRKDLVARRKLTGFPEQRPERAAGGRFGRAGRPASKPETSPAGGADSARLSESEIEALVRRIARDLLREIGGSTPSSPSPGKRGG
jgi:hypothetical protein